MTEKQTKYQRWKRRAHRMIDERLKNESKKEILLKFFIAPIIILFVSLLLFIFLDLGTFTKVGGLMIAYFFPPAGKETIIPTGIGLGINQLLIALAIAFVDIVTAIFLLWNYDFAKLVPFVGPWMEKIEKKGGKQLKENSWLEKLAFFGLVLFVIFPFQGSGGVGTSILGRVIGMDKFKVVYAITIGAVTGCLMIAYISDYFISYFKNDIYMGLILLIIIATILGVYNVFKHLKKS